MNPNNINDIKEYLAYDSSPTIDEEALVLAIRLAERNNEPNITWITDYILLRTSSVIQETQSKEVDSIQNNISLIDSLIKNTGNNNPLEFFKTHKYLIKTIFKNLNFSISTIATLLKKYNISNFTDPDLNWITIHIMTLLTSIPNTDQEKTVDPFLVADTIISELIEKLNHNGYRDRLVINHADLLVNIFLNLKFKFSTIKIIISGYCGDRSEEINNQINDKFIFCRNNPNHHQGSKEHFDSLIQLLEPIETMETPKDYFERNSDYENYIKIENKIIARFGRETIYETTVIESIEEYGENHGIHFDYIYSLVRI